MTRDQAKARAEEIVFIRCTLGDILCRCELAGIKTHTTTGKQRARTVLEEELIEHYTKSYTTE